MSPLFLTPEIISSIRNEIENLKVFIDVLRKEEYALMKGVIGDLQTYASVKSKYINNLKKFDLVLHKYMSEHGLKLINSYNIFPDQSESKAVWQEFMEFTLRAKELNDSNKLIISTLIQHNRCLYTALNCAAGKILVYGPSGQIYI